MANEVGGLNEWEREILRLNERVRYLESDRVPPIELRSIDNSIKIGENKTRIDTMKETTSTGFLERIFTNALTAKDKGVLVIAGLIIIALALIFFGPSAEAIIGIITALQGN